MKNTFRHRNRLSLAGLVLTAGLLAACGLGDADQKTGPAALDEHYANRQLPRDWTMKTIRKKRNGDLLLVVEIESENAIRFIKSKSRMTQFKIAKKACPVNTTELQKALGKGQRVWVRLATGSEKLTTSICPQPHSL